MIIQFIVILVSQWKIDFIEVILELYIILELA